MRIFWGLHEKLTPLQFKKGTYPKWCSYILYKHVSKAMYWVHTIMNHEVGAHAKKLKQLILNGTKDTTVYHVSLFWN